MVPFKPKEWAGVTAVGLALAYAANAAVYRSTPAQHRNAMLAAGAALYIIGVRIGASRPKAGW